MASEDVQADELITIMSFDYTVDAIYQVIPPECPKCGRSKVDEKFCLMRFLELSFTSTGPTLFKKKWRCRLCRHTFRSH